MATDPWPYVITIDELKAALGLPPDPDPVLDAKLENAIAMSQAMVEAYLCGNIMPTEHTWTQTPFARCSTIFLPTFPVISFEELLVNTVVQDPSQYTVDMKKGLVHYGTGCVCCRPYACCEYPPSSAEATYISGYDPVPADMHLALLNLAIGTYNLGGNFSGSVSSVGALKSMTMFDAMSMSFETSGAAGASGSDSLVSQWGWILDKYSMCSIVVV